MSVLPRRFYNRGAEIVAPELLGMLLIRRQDGIERIGRIVETEAYLGPHDLAAHSSRGKTARTAVMFGPPGHAYVYLIYGMHHCLNAVTGPEDHASAVLIRALEPLANIDGRTDGPGRLCRSLAIDRRLNGHDLRLGELVFARPRTKPPSLDIEARPRVGVHYAGEWAARPLRFSIRGNPFVSRA